MKIAIDIRNIGKKRTGDEAVFFNLVKNLALIDDKNTYLLLTDRKTENDDGLKESVEKLDLPKNFSLVSLCEKGANKFLWNAWILPKYLWNNPVNVLQVQYITPFFVSRKIKIATIVHDVSFRAYPELIGKKDLFFLNMLMPMSLRRADRVIGVSRFTTQEIMKYYHTKLEKLRWIHNAVGVNFREDIPARRLEEVRKKYALPEKFIFYIGTMQPRKNLSALIEAYVKIPNKKREGLALVLAGGKGHNLDKEIEKCIKDYGLENHVIMPGFICEEDKAAMFKLAHIFCFPSLYEGFGIPILEAMTLGVPTLASDIPPHIEVAGESIMFFEHGNPNDLSAKLEKLLCNESLRSELSEKEKIRAEEFSWQKTARKMLAVYNELDNKTK